MGALQAVYEVGSGKTYSTITLAVAQMSADWGADGSLPFTFDVKIRVYDGTYAEAITPPIVGQNTSARLIYKNAVGNSPVLNGGSILGIGVYCYGSSYNTIDGFEITGYTNIGVAITRNGGVGSTHITVQNCKIHDCPSINYDDTLNTYQIWANNLIYNGTGAGIGISSNNTLVYNNIVYNCGNHGIAFDGAQNAQVYNNDVNNFAFSGIYFNSNSINATVKNNIVTNCVSCIMVFDVDSRTGFVSDYNDLVLSTHIGYWGSFYDTLADWRTATSGDANSINADPLFAGTPTTDPNDYKILTASPCKDTAVTIADFSVDYFGTTRPQGSAWDMGIHEFVQSSPSTSNAVLQVTLQDPMD